MTNPALAPGEGAILNLVAEYSEVYKQSNNKVDWKELIDFLNSSETSQYVREVALYMLGEKTDVDSNISSLGDWYVAVYDNERYLLSYLYCL